MGPAMDDDGRRLQGMFEVAIRLGEQHGNRAIELALQLEDLHKVMWRALYQLRADRPKDAHHTLEQALKSWTNTTSKTSC